MVPLKYTVQDELAPSLLSWPDPDTGPWQVTLSWRWSEDRVECVGFCLQPLDALSVEPLTASLLRSIPVMRLVTQARRERYDASGGEIVETIDGGGDLPIGESLAASLREQSDSWSERRPGRPVELGPQHYREVAKVYSSAHASGGAPLVAVQEHWHVSRPTASRWVAEARAQELLPATGRGRAKGNAGLLKGKDR